MPVMFVMLLNVLAGKATISGACLPWFYLVGFTLLATLQWPVGVCSLLHSGQQSENNLAITFCCIDPSFARAVYASLRVVTTFEGCQLV